MSFPTPILWNVLQMYDFYFVFLLFSSFFVFFITCKFPMCTTQGVVALNCRFFRNSESCIFVRRKIRLFFASSSSPQKSVCSLCMWQYDYSRLQLTYFPLPFLLRWHPFFRWLQPDAFPRYWQHGMDEHAYMWHLVFCIIIVAMIALYSYLLIDSRLTFSFSLGWTVVEVNIYSTLY